MSTLIFDIETYGKPFETLSPVLQKNLLKNAKSDEEKEGIMSRTGLLPTSGEIVAIALMNAESKKGKVYFQAPEGGVENYVSDGVEYIVATEKEILENFWRDVKSFSLVVSFNGRGFDAPFILLRSIYYGILPTKNLMPYRYSNKEHYDIMDQLSFYGASKNYSLEVLCDMLGIRNPKDEGVSGLAVNDLFNEKKYKEIAEYCMRDVIATNELYQRVKSYMF